MSIHKILSVFGSNSSAITRGKDKDLDSLFEVPDAEDLKNQISQFERKSLVVPKKILHALGMILLWIDSPFAFLNIYLLCKTTKIFFDTRKGSKYTENIEFQFKHPDRKNVEDIKQFLVDFVKREKKYVANLSVVSSICINPIFKVMPHIRVLKLYRADQITDEIFQYLPHLRVLEIGLISLECKNTGFKQLKKLRNFTIDRLFFNDTKLNISEGIFGYLKGLEKLKLSHVNFKDSLFSNLKNLKELTLFKCNNITDDIFKYLKNIEELYIYQCDKIKSKGFKKLKMDKVRILKIEECKFLSKDEMEGVFSIEDLANMKFKVVDDEEELNEGSGEKKRGWSLIKDAQKYYDDIDSEDEESSTDEESDDD